MANITTVPITALASATSANGVARNGASLATNLADPGAIIVECTSAITTSSVLATFKLQSSRDGTTWFDLSGTSADQSTWASAAGTASPVTTRKVLWFPIAAHGHRFVRVVATLSGAATAAEDVTSATYVYAPIARLWGTAVPT